jgi:hypothetical protein
LACLAAIDDNVRLPFAYESGIVLVAAPIFTEDLAMDASFIVFPPVAGTITPFGVSGHSPASLSPAASVLVDLQYSGLVPFRMSSYSSIVDVLATAVSFPLEKLAALRSETFADALVFPAKPRAIPRRR